MAVATKPQKKKSKKKDTPPAANDAAPETLSKPNPQSITNINILTTTDKKMDIKMYAMMHKMSMTELLLKSFDFYKENHS